ncbi:MAG: molybdenum cofactor biosynthesis protein MoaE [Actinobacteria bacterium]|nr:molybdenum cofactor biosynthesis protein MoaE [Actinomycetota bacterium]
MRPVQPPDNRDTWVGLTSAELPVAVAYEWCVLPNCGAVVLFSGVVRDHAVDDEGILRADVQHLVYEAYESAAVEAFDKIAGEVRVRWPQTGRIALLHRTGRLELGESSVIAAVSSPHRAEAFEAARYAIDALKASAPIWKHETWLDSESGTTRGWGTGSHDIVDPATVPSVRGA